MEKHAHKWHLDEGKPLAPETIARLENPSRKKAFAPSAWTGELGDVEGRAVADVACGTGFFIADILGAVGAEGRVFAIDIDSRMVEYVRNRFSDEGRVVPLKSTADKIPLDDGSVDAAAMISTFHDLDGDATLREIWRILKKGGKFAVADWKRGEGSPTIGPPNEIRVGAEEAGAALRKIGFEVSFFEVSKDVWGITAQKKNG